jgi:hypothetical protein
LDSFSILEEKLCERKPREEKPVVKRFYMRVTRANENLREKGKTA